jgi:hypothetical protein
VDREFLRQTLARVEQHIAIGERNLARQEELIASILATGGDVSLYRDALANFMEIQHPHIEHLQRLKRDLSEVDRTYR